MKPWASATGSTRTTTRAAIAKRPPDVLTRRSSDDGDRKPRSWGLEETAARRYFVSRSLYPNVDFYTGLIYQAMGFPTKMFTPIRHGAPGWIAQVPRDDRRSAKRIGRPRQVYDGSPSATAWPCTTASGDGPVPGHAPASPGMFRVTGV